MVDEERFQRKDANSISERVSTLSNFHFVLALFSLLSLVAFKLYFKVFHWGFNTNSFTISSDQGTPFKSLEFFEMVKWLYPVLIGVALISILLNLVDGIMMKRHINRRLCIALSVVNYIIFPFGTALGFVTISHLQKEEYSSLFKS